jgi:hypothetical protein
MLEGFFLEDGLRGQAAAFEVDQKTASASRSVLTGVSGRQGRDESNSIARKACASQLDG